MSLTGIIEAHRWQGTGYPWQECACGWGCSDAAHNALNQESEWAAHLAAELDKARTITTVEELNRIWPIGTVIQEIHSCDEDPICEAVMYPPIWQFIFHMGFMRVDVTDMNDFPVDAVTLPARILWLPTDGAE